MLKKSVRKRYSVKEILNSPWIQFHPKPTQCSKNHLNKLWSYSENLKNESQLRLQNDIMSRYILAKVIDFQELISIYKSF